jgi:ATP-dependent protease HslVU (ClpYQ) peptidase subunit
LVDGVGVVEVVVEFDSDGPDSLGFGAGYATAAAPAMMRPARQLAAKSLRFMTTLGSGCARSAYPHLVYEWWAHRVQKARIATLN